MLLKERTHFRTGMTSYTGVSKDMVFSSWLSDALCINFYCWFWPNYQYHSQGDML